MELQELIQRFSKTREQQEKAIFSTLFILGNRLQTIFDERIPDITLKQFMLLSLIRQADTQMTFTQSVSYTHLPGNWKSLRNDLVYTV